MFVKYDIRYGIISNLTRKLVLMTSFIIILLIFIWNNGSFGIYSYSHHQFNGWFDPYFTRAGLFDLWVNWFREDLRVLLNLLKQVKSNLSLLNECRWMRHLKLMSYSKRDLSCVK